ncbi:MAG: hypothetical protein KDA81_14810 [Planctomycetaceae bacterium]|nr:hypothetical protein [Planctomycetaceae bacterium]
MTFFRAVFLWMLTAQILFAQNAGSAKVELGSRTAKNGFENENQIRDKFNEWKDDSDARNWLKAMNYSLGEIRDVTASKPHGQKADVEVTIRTRSDVRTERISIKLVSSENGFNQIDKRWLDTYAVLWDMPPNVVLALKLYVGETPPQAGSRHAERMYLDELDEDARAAVIDFFRRNKDVIVSDLLAGNGEHRADWFMVAYKATDKPRWLIRSADDTVRFFGEGDVELTRAGNLKIGRISMQRKGGDNGRETAKMLQFKINPVQLFDAQ